MICFVVPEAGSFSIRTFLAGEGACLANRIRIVSFEQLPALRTLPVATWIFAGVDQLGSAQRQLAALICDRLSHADVPVRLINHPTEVLLRADLLRAAHAAGINDFRAVGAASFASRAARSTQQGRAISQDALRYPVFVRESNGHGGSLTELLPNRAALDRALFRLRIRGHQMDDLLVVEFCDTSDDDGIFRKFSAFVVGQRIMARYLNAGRQWMVKQEGRIYESRFADDEVAFLDGNPHEEWLRQVFALARTEYGRIDYGVRGGKPQLWEINTNPTIGRSGKPRVRPPEAERYRERIGPARARFYAAFRDAWRSIDSDATGTLAFDPPASLLRDIRSEQATRSAGWQRDLVRRVGRWGWARRIARGVEPFAATAALGVLRILHRDN